MNGNVVRRLSGLGAWGQTQLSGLYLVPASSLGITSVIAMSATVMAMTTYRLYSAHFRSAVSAAVIALTAHRMYSIYFLSAV